MIGGGAACSRYASAPCRAHKPGNSDTATGAAATAAALRLRRRGLRYAILSMDALIAQPPLACKANCDAQEKTHEQTQQRRGGTGLAASASLLGRAVSCPVTQEADIKWGATRSHSTRVAANGMPHSCERRHLRCWRPWPQLDQPAGGLCSCGHHRHFICGCPLCCNAECAGASTRHAPDAQLQVLHRAVCQRTPFATSQCRSN